MRHNENDRSRDLLFGAGGESEEEQYVVFRIAIEKALERCLPFWPPIGITKTGICAWRLLRPLSIFRLPLSGSCCH